MGRARKPRATAGGAAVSAGPPAKLNQRLVLNGWLLHLFEVTDADDLLDEIRDKEQGGLDVRWLDGEGVSEYYRRLALHQERALLPHADLLRYDDHIVRHWRSITDTPDRRALALKHFQYLALLFTEVYLDRYFADEARLLDDLNAWVETWNTDRPYGDQAEPFAKDDLNKLAFWMATGSGKTLLMHVNIKQYLHYLEAAGRRHELNRILLLTPNEGLSRQHLNEFAESGIEAARFAKEGGRSLFSFGARSVEVIEISKLSDESKDLTVAVDSFEGNNLVLVDEGHRGSSSGESGEWMRRRAQLCATGFSFEYSATFGQAIKPSGTAKAQGGRLVQEYGHCILFDYSYRFFHRDGYGKEFQILNLATEPSPEQRPQYLTGALLSFLQQQMVFREQRATVAEYGIEAPLWVFVGSRVAGAGKADEESDIADIVSFLAAFVLPGNRDTVVGHIAALKASGGALLDTQGHGVFANRLTALFDHREPEAVYDLALTHIFNAPQGGALHLTELSGTEAKGEIALRVAENPPFGVINVGDASAVTKVCATRGIEITPSGEFSDSLFRKLDQPDSNLTLLIGARKFTEGWSSWRVSTLGLMRVGQKEGSEIIQLFGRGVRLRGLRMSLKRHTFIQRPDGQPHPTKALTILETLNVFGIRANYMTEFRNHLREEGVELDEPEGISIGVIRSLKDDDLAALGLFTLQMPSGLDFKQNGAKPVLTDIPVKSIVDRPVTIDWTPRIEVERSKGAQQQNSATMQKEHHPLTEAHLDFLDIDAIWLALQRHKSERAWYNFAIPREAVRPLLEDATWYRLLVTPGQMEFDHFGQVRTWQEMAIALLKKYCERLYRLSESQYQEANSTSSTLDATDRNFIAEYRVEIPHDQSGLVSAANTLRERMERGERPNTIEAGLEAISMDEHLYTPLLHLTSGGASVSPAALNPGERRFVRDLRRFIAEHPKTLDGRDVYLLRNTPHKGIGFAGYYPDFILWVKESTRQHVAFVDPKGLRNLQENDDEVALATTIKSIEARLANPAVTLDSFLISTTEHQKSLGWSQRTLSDLEARHVLFPDVDETRHIGRMLELMGA